MVKNNLKVGDKFVDGDLQYEVISLTNIDGVYISKVVGKAPTTATPKAETKETDITTMAYSDLKKMAKEKGVSGKGSKEEVIERIQALD